MERRAAPLPPRNNIAAYAVAALSMAVGVGSLIVFTVFLYTGSFHLTNFKLTPTEQLLLDASLCLAFFLQHSGMVREASQRWMSYLIPGPYLAAVFSIMSGIVLLALVVLWQETALMLASADGMLRWSLRAIFFLAIAGQVWGTWSLRSADLFGTKTLLNRAAPPPASLVVRGPYRWVRHPLYSTTILMLWSYPDLTVDRLLFNTLFTVWIIAGTVLEERDLVREYGGDYQRYQREVPMLIPYRKPIEA